jgi:hypothetical protein
LLVALFFALGAWHRRRLLHGPCGRTTWPGMHAHLEHPSLVFFSCMPRARRRGAAPCPAAARCVHGNWNSYTVAAQPMGSSCKPFPLPGPAALGGVFTSPNRPTDRPAGGGPGRGAQVDGGLATSAAAPHWGGGACCGHWATTAAAAHSCAPELTSSALQPIAQCWDGQGRRGGLSAHECAGDASRVQKYQPTDPAAEPTSQTRP